MAGRCGVEDDVIVSAPISGQKTHELIEGGDLRRASSGQLLFHCRALGVACSLHLLQYTSAIGLGGGADHSTPR